MKAVDRNGVGKVLQTSVSVSPLGTDRFAQDVIDNSPYLLFKRGRYSVLALKDKTSGTW